MEFVSKYKAHIPDSKGMVKYTAEENSIWEMLYKRQEKLWPGRACKEYIDGLKALDLSADKIPQLPDVNKKLKNMTGWEVAPVAALISEREFFELLAARKFPAATFIRIYEELDYVQEPDIFHELVGHCPMLTNQVYADFMHEYAQKVLSFSEKDWPLLQRLFWFTVEFGLIYTSEGLRIYGGGILSSINETVYSVESSLPQRTLFDPLVAFRTPYRIDEMQKVYFVIHDYKQLYNTVRFDLAQVIQEARNLGEFPPLFKDQKNNPSIHIRVC